MRIGIERHCNTHEMRNEMVEELNTDQVSESGAEQSLSLVRSGRTKGMTNETGRSRGEARKSQGKRPWDSTRTSSLVREEGAQRWSRWGYTVAKPSEVAKPAGIPNNVIVTCPAVSERALRASRAAHERRECARCARERITSALGGEVAAGGDRLTSRRWCRASWIQARRWTLRLQSRQRSGAEPTWSGCNSTLT